MTMNWLTLSPGDNLPNVIEDPLDENAIILLPPDMLPDTVRLPPNLGGQVVQVLARKTAACACGQDHIVDHLILEEGLAVCPCDIRNEFLWYRWKEGGS